MAALRRRVDDQRALIDSFHTRVAAVRSEITAWRALHAKMWDALGPEAGAGAGGATPEAVGPAAGVEPSPREELDLLATSVTQEGPRLRELAHAIGRTGKIVHALPLRWPVHGPVKSGYGMRRSPWDGAREHHDGIDIGSPPGTPVESPAPGTVVEASPQGSFGKHVMLDHGNGVRSLYGHLKKLDVKVGQRVAKGQVIGLVGSTGRRDVVVRDGRIAAIGPPGLAGAGLAEIGGRGGTLLPGLVDVHTHTGSTPNPPWKVSLLPDVGENLAAFLYAGVTTVLDLGSLSPAVFRERERLATGEHLGPRLYAAGPIFTAPGGHPAEVLRAWLPWYLRGYVVARATREVATPDEARRAVAALLPERPDVLKLAIDAGASDVPRLAPETIAAIAAAGHAARVRSIAHIGSSAEAVDAVRAGVDALAHAPWRDELTDEAVAIIAGARVPVVVTLAIWDLAGAPRTGAPDFLPIEREVAQPAVIAALLAPPPPPDAATAAFQHAAAAAHDARRRNVAKLRAAGVPVLAGSDACNAGDS